VLSEHPYILKEKNMSCSAESKIEKLFTDHSISMNDRKAILFNLLNKIEKQLKVYKPIAEIIRNQADDLAEFAEAIKNGEYALDEIVARWNEVVQVDETHDRITRALAL